MQNDTRDIRISIDDLHLILTQLNKSKRDDIQMIAEMLAEVMESGDSEELNDLTA